MDKDSLSFFCPSYSMSEGKEEENSLPSLLQLTRMRYPFSPAPKSGSLSLSLSLSLSFWICIIQDLLSASVCLFHFLSSAGVCARTRSTILKSERDGCRRREGERDGMNSRSSGSRHVRREETGKEKSSPHDPETAIRCFLLLPSFSPFTPIRIRVSVPTPASLLLCLFDSLTHSPALE